MSIDTLLAELYAIDPALRDHEPAVRRAIEALLAQKPDTRFDAAFAARLRADIIAASAASVPPSRFSAFLSSLRMKPLQFLIPAAGFAAILALVVVQSQPGAQSPLAGISSPHFAILEEGAFGPLVPASGDAFATQGRGGELAERSAIAPSAAPAPAADNAVGAPAIGMGGGGAGSSGKLASPDAMMIWPGPNPTVVKYAFAGELPQLSDKVTVLRRVPGLTAAAPDALSASFGSLIDLDKFRNLKMQSVSLMQDEAYGFAIYADFNEGSLSLSQNSSRWPHPEWNCRDEACYERLRLSEKDVPSDQKLVDITDAFLASHGVSKSNFGTPVVSRDWYPVGIMQDAAARIYVPESIGVTYPLLIDGMPVYEQNGAPYGLVVNVNIREQRVDGMWNLLALNFQKSAYDAETDPATLQKFIEQGGVYPTYSGPEASVTTVTLGAPQQVLMHTYQHDGVAGTSHLFVPALRFPTTPVEQKPDQYAYVPPAVMIPLAKELLNVQYPVPMPLDIRATEPSAGAATPPAAAIDPAVLPPSKQ